MIDLLIATGIATCVVLGAMLFIFNANLYKRVKKSKEQRRRLWKYIESVESRLNNAHACEVCGCVVAEASMKKVLDRTDPMLRWNYTFPSPKIYCKIHAPAYDIIDSEPHKTDPLGDRITVYLVKEDAREVQVTEKGKPVK